MSKYQIIYADPPYPIRWVNVPTKSGFKGLSYPTMGIAEMCNMPIKELADDYSKCFVWTTNHFLLEGLFLIRSWGFQYDKLWVWCKKTGAGGHPRTATEYVIEGTRGLIKSIGATEKATNNWFVADRGRHSQKPVVVYEMIERFYPNTRKIELFARNRRDGWDVFGNQVEGSICLPTPREPDSLKAGDSNLLEAESARLHGAPEANECAAWNAAIEAAVQESERFGALEVADAIRMLTRGD